MIKQFVRQIKTSVLKSRISEISQKVVSSNLTYLPYQKIINLENCIQDISKQDIPGIFIEAGVALGGSAIIISSLMPENRSFHGYDVFEMIPPPSEKDDEMVHARYDVIKSGNSKGIGGDVYYGYLDNLYERVINNFNSFGLQVDQQHIYLHKGLFEATMNFSKENKVALAHIDCDWYEPVYFCLSQIYPALSKGGYIILDDYHDYGGCKKAVDEFLAKQSDIRVATSNSNLVLVRI
jgi:O-methyltransferase